MAGTSEDRLCSRLRARCNRKCLGYRFLGSAVHWDERGQPFFEVLDQWGQGFRMQSRNPYHAVAPTQGLRLPARKLVAFVEYQDPWKPIEGEALKHDVDRCDMGIQIFRPRIDHMQEQVGIAQFVQCRSEGCEEIFGQVANKPHRIGDDDFPAMRKTQSAARGVERFKDAWGRTNLTVR